MTRPMTLVLALITLTGAPAAAQQFTDSTLALAVRLVTEGQGDSARALVRAELATTNRSDSLYPEALFAAGLVAEHLDSALAAFRRVAIEFSGSPWATMRCSGSHSSCSPPATFPRRSALRTASSATTR